jgi:YfiH family protein
MTSPSDVDAVELGVGVGAWFTGDRFADLDDANLAHHRPHVPERLAQARDAVGRATATDPSGWHLMRQVHAARVATVGADVPLGAELRDVDVLVTGLAGRVLVVLAADCIPILAAGAVAIGAAHAGWRGLQADVPGALVAGLRDLGERPEDLRMVLGPTIGPCCYEVGPEVVEVIAAIDPRAVMTTRIGTPSVDLRAAARTRLLELGVGEVVLHPFGPGGAIARRGVATVTSSARGTTGCTACEDGWFSHRRDPAAGRHAGIIVRREEGGS